MTTPRWEYQMHEAFEPVMRKTLATLNRYGGEGWETYAVTRAEAAVRVGQGSLVITEPRAILQFHMRRPATRRKRR